MKVGIVGLGYVGLPLAVAFAEAGEQSSRSTSIHARSPAIAAGDSYIEDVPSERLQAVCRQIRRHHALRRAGQGRRDARSASRRR